MTELVLLVVVFVTAGAALLLGPLVMGRLVRPDRPSPEKGEVYECGEPAVGSAWVQFDLRFYVVALLFVIFDVELAFFFPWAVVFGTANRAADPTLAADQPRRRGGATRPVGARGPGPVGDALAGVAGVRGHPGVLRGAAGRVRVPVAPRRPGVGPQYCGAVGRGRGPSTHRLWALARRASASSPGWNPGRRRRRPCRVAASISAVGRPGFHPGLLADAPPGLETNRSEG